MSERADLVAAQECIRKSIALIAEARKPAAGSKGAKESNVRHSFSSYLRLIFPDVPWWVEDHISRGEANSAFSIEGKAARGFVDNLVGLTAIEYETDLEKAAKFAEGFAQVKNYCASLLNQGHNPDYVLGVLSDTVRWRAYRVASITGTPGALGGAHLELQEIDQLDLSKADTRAAEALVAFLQRHLGRRGSRPLNAASIASDLGFDSKFSAARSATFSKLVKTAFTENPKYSELITQLWCNFVTYIRDKGAAASFEPGAYADELYLLTLAKLICANVIARKSLLSDDDEIASILDGRFFESRGLTNLVEYDYFGWLNREPFLEHLIPAARDMQRDLEAYDFGSAPTEDLFGQLMAQLARRTQRLLLGQEWTPSWLAQRLVDEVLSRIPRGVAPALVDMCCGSGSMIVAAVHRAKESVGKASHLTAAERIQSIAQVITGFDIDPLAVLLSKINWVLAARDWLEPFDGSISVSIPVYHADSLFAITPLSAPEGAYDEDDVSVHHLKIAEHSVELPLFLLSPPFQPLFDRLLDRAYTIAAALSSDSKGSVTSSVAEAAVDGACQESASVASEVERGALVSFLAALSTAICLLHRDGRNGIWAFILRNSFRPGLVTGRFNGLVSNPPWLALSKIADNPYKNVLRQRAKAFGIQPGGPAHLHVELATIFLLHAIERYLQDAAVIGCIVPDTVLNGKHHARFRAEAYRCAEKPVDWNVDTIWKVGTGTFKNEACVLFGRRANGPAGKPDPIPGLLVTEETETPLAFERVRHGDLVVWSDRSGPSVGTMSHEPAAFRQGADVMPRTLLFHEMVQAAPAGGTLRWTVRPIDKATSRLAFVLKDAKKNTGFRIIPRTLPDRYVFDVLTSNLLAPFEIATPLKALLPIQKDETGTWVAVSGLELAAYPSAKAAFDQILSAFGKGRTVEDLFRAIDSDRRKLTQQHVPNSGFLVFTGAGGKFTCAAYLDLAMVNVPKLIVDQTLYWATVASEDEAIYLTGLLNSEAINEAIRRFQPRGAFGERHVHKLAHDATPQFDARSPVHAEVVRATRNLLAEFNALKGGDSAFAALMDPNTTKLDIRRRKIRERLSTLPAYPAYEDACRAVCGSPSH